MNEFKTYHPIVNFEYFVFVIGFSMFLMHPICLAVSFVCAFAYSVMLCGAGTIKKNLAYMIPIMTITSLINPLLNHEGITIIGYFPNGNPITSESVIYGFFASVMLVSVICWFSCSNEIMTSDKFVYLFGKIIPSMSMVLSMTLRFVPRFARGLKSVSDAQKCIGMGMSDGGIIRRSKNAVAIMSVMITQAFENSIETADSMKSRGYGLKGRTSFSLYSFDSRDLKAAICITLTGLYTLIGKLKGGMDFDYFPSFGAKIGSRWSISVFAAYILLCACPIIIEILEAIRWKVLKSKI